MASFKEKAICPCPLCKTKKNPTFLRKNTIEDHLVKHKDYIPPPPTNPHEKAKKEKIDLSDVQNHWNNNTPSGLKIKQAYMTANPGKPVPDCINVVGGRGKHFDLVLKWTSNECPDETVEAKLCRDKKPINPEKPPWYYGVQYANMHANKFTIGYTYLKEFYDTMLDEIQLHYNINSAKPTYEEWVKDAFASGKPTTPFVIELREKGYCSEYLSNTRKKFNKSFMADENSLQILKSEMLAFSNEVLREKDNWLQIHGNMENPDDFEVRWTGKIEMSEIVTVTQTKCKNGCDINFKFTCVDGAVYEAKMRWGYGQCITNLRIDLK